MEGLVRFNHISSGVANNITEMFGIDPKGAIGADEFNEKYGSGHEIYTQDKVEEFMTKAISDGQNSDQIMETVGSLKPVLVKNGTSYKEFLVKKTDNGQEEEK